MIKSLLSAVLEKGTRRISHLVDNAVRYQPAHRAPKVLLYLNLPQDLDMLLPIAIRLKERNQYPIETVVSRKAWQQSPRIDTLLTKAGIQPQIVNHKAAVAGLQPSLRNVCAVISASESTASAHRGAHTLTQRANRQGIATYTLQHGYENVGLTYFDEEHPVGSIAFASQKIFTWGPLADLPDEVSDETRQKCVAVGCPKFAETSLVNASRIKADVLGSSACSAGIHSPEGGLLVAVFENLHWCRYSDRYRQQFIEDLEQMATDYPDITVLVKPHHTGRWLTQEYQGRLPTADNLIIADPTNPKWEIFTAPALIEIADVVITTPSTVAVDAVRAGKPVAVVAYDMDLSNYKPLPLLRSSEDWRSLMLSAGTCSASVNPSSATKSISEFSQKHLVPGDVIEKILDDISADITNAYISESQRLVSK